MQLIVQVNNRQNLLIKALCKAEDETDALAATQVQAEQKAELAEFDENIPWDEREADIRKEEEEVSRVEIELAMIDKEVIALDLKKFKITLDLLSRIAKKTHR